MFNVSFFGSFPVLFSGLVLGTVFGFLLRKANVTHFNVIVKQLLLKDFTVMKVIFTAIIVGSIGIYAMHAMDIIQLNISNRTLLTAALGGGVFGVGMAILGYCPGTAIAALADGAKDMYFGILGMLFGAVLFAWMYPVISRNIKITNPTGLTLSKVSGLSPWIIIVILAVIAGALFYFIDKSKNTKAS